MRGKKGAKPAVTGRRRTGRALSRKCGQWTGGFSKLLLGAVRLGPDISRGLHPKSLNLAHEFVGAKGLGQKVGPVVGGRDLHAFHRLVENGLAHEEVMLGDVAGP